MVLATARPPRSVLPYYQALDLQTAMINYNGALVYHPRETRVIMHKPLMPKAARKVVHIARQLCPEIVVSAEIMDQWFTDRVDERYMTETAHSHEPDQVGPLDEFLNHPITKLLMLGEPHAVTAIRKSIDVEMPGRVRMVQTEGFLLQIMHPTVSKVQALRAVAGELNVRRDHIMAIGDNANDVGMLQWAGVGVAMGNASPEALAAADMVTGHNDADGVAEAIRKVIYAG